MERSTTKVELSTDHVLDRVKLSKLAGPCFLELFSSDQNDLHLNDEKTSIYRLLFERKAPTFRAIWSVLRKKCSLFARNASVSPCYPRHNRGRTRKFREERTGSAK